MFLKNKIYDLKNKISNIDAQLSYLNEVDLIQNGKLLFFYYKQDNHYIVIPDRYKLAHNPKLIKQLENYVKPKWKEISDSLFAVNSVNTDAAKEDFKARAKYLFKILSNFKNLFNNNFCVIDVGANYGLITMLLVSMLEEFEYDKKIYAFEPGVSNKLIEKNFNLNHMSHKIKFFPYAAGNFNNYSLMYYDLGQSQDNRLVNPLPTTLSSPVRTVRLDSFLEQEGISSIPLFIKIDTQGYEPCVFDGLEKIIKKETPCIIETEFTPWCYETELFNDLKATGFLTSLLKNFRIFHHDISEGLEEIKSNGIQKFVNKINDTPSKWTDILCISHGFPDIEKMIIDLQ